MRDWPVTRLGGLMIVVADRAASAAGFIAEAKKPRPAGRRPFYSTSANGEVLARAAREPDLAAELALADQIHADGMPMVIYSRLFSALPLPERVATTDLVHDVARLAARENVSFYFLGGTEEVNRRAVEKMSRRYPGLVFAGRRNGYFRQEDEDTVVDEIVGCRPDILWIGMGVPLEQAFVRRHRDRLGAVGVVKTSGGLFDFLSGRRTRAPRLLQIVGLEWAWRMALEPRRLGRRYLMTNGAALRQLIRDSR